MKDIITVDFNHSQESVLQPKNKHILTITDNEVKNLHKSTLSVGFPGAINLVTS